MKAVTALRIPLILLGLILLFVAERYLNAEKYFVAVRIAAFVTMLASVAVTVFCLQRAKKAGLAEEAKSWLYALGWQVGVLASCAVYLGYVKVLGSSAAPESFAAKALLAGWLLLVILGLAAGIGIEWSIRESGRGPLAEHRRVELALGSWLSVGVLLAFFVTLNFVATQKDKSYDWSYLKVTTPSESSMKMAATLTEPLKVGVFFPPGNEVRQFVEQYFTALSRQEPKIQVEFYDKDMSPTIAESYKVSKNGQIVMDMAGKQERIDTGLKLATARNTLKKLDGEFQKAFLALTSQKKTAYFTRGHGELSWIGANAAADESGDPLKSLKVVEAFLRNQNYGLRLFGVAEGSAKEVPEDASLVVIMGPDKPFMQEEADALKSYLARGGKLLVMLDIETPTGDLLPADAKQSEDPLLKLLESMGVRYGRAPLANDKNYVSATRSPADVWFLFSNVFTSHESVALLARHEERAAVLMFKTGSLTVTPELTGWQNLETVRTLSETFIDTDRNFAFDKDKEARNTYVVGAATTRKAAPPAKEGTPAPADPSAAARMIVFADATAASDALLRNPGNLAFFADAVKWLAGESKTAGALSNEEDVKIQHTRKEDIAWFYGTVVAVPLLVLGAGLLGTRRGRGRRSGGGKADNHAA